MNVWTVAALGVGSMVGAGFAEIRQGEEVRSTLLTFSLFVMSGGLRMKVTPWEAEQSGIGRAVITATSPIGRRSAEPAVQIRCLWGCADFCPPVIIGNCVHPRFAASKIPTVDCRCDAGHRHWLLLCRKLSRSKLVGKPAGTLGVGRNQFPLRAVLFAALTK
jgi:hypothetical protein